MDITIQPGALSGTVTVLPSKSQAHRLLICAAFADRSTQLLCRDTNRDIEATVDCLQALGADIRRTSDGYFVTPIRTIPETAVLDCGECGSTLRFMLPIVGALGVDATIHMAGRLPQRPLSPLWEKMEEMGCSLTRPTDSTIRCRGKLREGEYVIDGSVSSQFITGLLFAMALMKNRSTLKITGNIESRPYIEMTRIALALFDAPHFRSPSTIAIEGDWSNGAFWLAARSFGSNLDIKGLHEDSPQGDRAVDSLIPRLQAGFETISAADIPDLIPILAVIAAANKGAAFTHIQRLRLKESDRVASVTHLINTLGGKADATEDTLTIHPAKLIGGTVDTFNDHRIAMAAAIAATLCTQPVTIIGAEAVNKSYPQFWAEYRRLGGNYEQHIR